MYRYLVHSRLLQLDAYCTVAAAQTPRLCERVILCTANSLVYIVPSGCRRCVSLFSLLFLKVLISVCFGVWWVEGDGGFLHCNVAALILAKRECESRCGCNPRFKLVSLCITAINSCLGWARFYYSARI